MIFKLLGVSIAFTIATFGGVHIFDLVLKFYDPFIYNDVKIISEKVEQGDCLIERLDVTRNRICKVEIDRFLVEDNTKNVFFRERVPGGATAIGKNITNNVVCPIPGKPWPIGKVTILQNVHSECIDGMHSMQWPVLHFEVIPKSQP